MKTALGQTLFELVVAIAVAVLVVTGIVAVVTVSVRNANFARDQAQATRYGQEAMEWLRQERNKDWATFRGRAASPKWCLKNLSWDTPVPCSSSDFISGTYFLRWAELAVSDDSVSALVRVSWTDSQGTHQSRVDTVFNNINAP